MYLWDVGSGLAHMHGVIAPAKFKRGMFEMKILGSEILWCVFRCVGAHAWCDMESCSGKVQYRDV